MSGVPPKRRRQAGRSLRAIAANIGIPYAPTEARAALLRGVDEAGAEQAKRGTSPHPRIRALTNGHPAK